MDRDYAFEMAASNLRFGSGTTLRSAWTLPSWDRRVLVLTDRNLAASQPVQIVRESLEKEGISYSVFDEVRIEPRTNR